MAAWHNVPLIKLHVVIIAMELKSTSVIVQLPYLSLTVRLETFRNKIDRLV